MNVTITVQFGDQEVEVTRTAADALGAGSRVPVNRHDLEQALELAVGDIRRACELAETSAAGRTA